MRDSNVRAHIVLPRKLKKELKRRAKITHGSVSQLVRLAVIDFFDEELLFSVESDGIREDLNRGFIPGDLRDKFEEEGRPLSNPRLIQREVGWKINDGDEAYTVRDEEEGKLNVYIKDDGGGGELDLRPVVEQLEKIEKRMEQVGNELKELKKGTKGKKGSTIEKVADDIWELLLERGEDLSVVDMAEISGYSESETLKGIEKLENEAVVKRVEEENRPTKWKIRGG